MKQKNKKITINHFDRGIKLIFRSFFGLIGKCAASLIRGTFRIFVILKRQIFAFTSFQYSQNRCTLIFLKCTVYCRHSNSNICTHISRYKFWNLIPYFFIVMNAVFLRTLIIATYSLRCYHIWF